MDVLDKPSTAGAPAALPRAPGQENRRTFTLYTVVYVAARVAAFNSAFHISYIVLGYILHTVYLEV